MQKTLSIAACVGAILFATGAAAQSHSYCDQYARDYAKSYSDGREVLGGAAVGAVGGAIIGGIIGGSRGAGTGAAIGGGTGAVAGAATHSQRYNDAYNYAYRQCMNSSRAQYHGRPAPGSPDWHAYCASKYRSYRPETGMYRTYSGQWRYCQ
jgi:hypothetical protein